MAVAFAVANGVNDGGALLSLGLVQRTLRPLSTLLVLTAAVVVAPVLVGTAVATTLTSRLTALDGDGGEVALLVAVTTAVVVTAVLSRRRLPTSLTLAVVGGITGAGLGAGLPVAWPMVARVVALAAAAPVAGLVLATMLARLAGALPVAAPVRRRVRRWHVVGFGMQCLAYGTNDGQKMFAVLAVAAGTVADDRVPIVPWQLAVVGAAFLVGTVIGLPRIAPTLAGGVAPVRPPEAAIAELSASSVVLGSAVLAAPVSMTQAVSGAVVGASGSHGYRRIRWRVAARIGLAWVVTLPSATLVAAAVAATARAAGA